MGELVCLAVDGDKQSLQLWEVEFHANTLIEKSFLVVQTRVFVKVDAKVAKRREIAVVELLQQADTAAEGIVMTIFINGFIAIEEPFKFFHAVEVFGIRVVQINIEPR